MKVLHVQGSDTNKRSADVERAEGEGRPKERGEEVEREPAETLLSATTTYALEAHRITASTQNDAHLVAWSTTQGLH